MFYTTLQWVAFNVPLDKWQIFMRSTAQILNTTFTKLCSTVVSNAHIICITQYALLTWTILLSSRKKRRYNQCGTIKISQLCDENAEKPEQCGVISYGLLSLVQKWWPPSNFGSKGMKLQFLGKLCQDMSSSSSYLILGMGATITHTRLTALFPGLHRWAGTRKLKPIWILLKPQERIYSLVLRWLQCEVYRIIETSVQYPG